MSVLAWMLLGLVGGLVASKLISGVRHFSAFDMVFGSGGAFLFGWLLNAAGVSGFVGFGFHSLVVAIVGAALTLALLHGIGRALAESEARQWMEFEYGWFSERDAQQRPAMTSARGGAATTKGG